MAMNQSCYALKDKESKYPFFTYSFSKYAIAKLKEKASGAVFSALVTRDFEMEKVFNPKNDNIEDYPLVMDAPFSNADETHIKNISAVLPEVANQVIMFVMEKDWQYAESVMSSRVGKYCKLKKFSESHTEIEE